MNGDNIAFFIKESNFIEYNRTLCNLDGHGADGLLSEWLDGRIAGSGELRPAVHNAVFDGIAEGRAIICSYRI